MAWLVATLKEPRCARALRAAICGSKYKGLLLSGTGGSNPSSSSGQSTYSMQSRSSPSGMMRPEQRQLFRAGTLDGGLPNFQQFAALPCEADLIGTVSL
jgi:hypothetical protein